MRRITSKLFLTGALLTGMLASGPQAQATSLIVPGSRDSSAGTISFGQGDSYVRLYMEANRSYACTFITNSIPAATDVTFDTLINSSIVTVGPLNLKGAVTPVVGSAITSVPGHRATFTLSGDSGQTDGVYYFHLLNSGSSAYNGRAECGETTLYGGYNTNVSNFNFLEIVNISNSPVSGTITATNSNGTVVINKQAFSVSANNRLDVDIHTPAGAGKYGSIRVTHDAPLGALQAYVSQYNGTATSFLLSGIVPLRTRDDSF